MLVFVTHRCKTAVCYEHQIGFSGYAYCNKFLTGAEFTSGSGLGSFWKLWRVSMATAVSCKHQKSPSPSTYWRQTWGKVWREGKCERRPCAVSHMNEQQHMTYPQILRILFFWVARRYFQPKQTAPWLIHDGRRGWIKYSYLTHKHTKCIFLNFIFKGKSWFLCFFDKSGC